MKVNFFAPVYQREQVRKDAEFGLNDGIQLNGEEGMAYSTTDEAEKPWNACVKNTESHEVKFLPLDHNIIIHPAPSETYSLCDGMLWHDKEWLAFVELKVRGGGWIQNNIDQLQSTIGLFNENHDYKTFRHREAYAANRKHPAYHYSHKVQMNEFRSKTKFRLIIQSTIVVK